MTIAFLTAGKVRWTLTACVAVQSFLPLALQPFAAAEEQSPAQTFYIHDGDRVVFYGDSITEQAHYTLPIETFVRTRCPDVNVSFFNSGWSGDRAWGGEGGSLEERLRRDVIARRPTVVTVMLGMNDGYYMNFDPKAVAAFKQSLEKLIDTLDRALPGVRITLIGTSPYDNVTPGDRPDWEKSIEGGYNCVVVRFSAATREVAEKHHLLFVDMNTPLVQLLKQLQDTEPGLARQLFPDRIHPGPVAGLVMAARLLTAWNSPIPETTIAVDAKTAIIGRLRVRRVLPLPFPLDRNDALTNLVAATSPDLKPFTGATLRITDALFSKASIEIDGNEIGIYAADQLAAGIDLSAIDTPLVDRAMEVSKLIRLRNRIHFIQQRNLALSYRDEQPACIKQAVAELAAIEQQLAELEQASARRAPHSIELIATEQ